MQLECKQTTESKLIMSQPMNIYYQEGMDIEVSHLDQVEETQTPTVVRLALNETDDAIHNSEIPFYDLTTEEEIPFTIDRNPSLVDEEENTNMVGLYQGEEDDDSTTRLYESDSESTHDSMPDLEEYDAQLEEDINVVEAVLDGDLHGDLDEEDDQYIGLASIARAIGIQSRQYYRRRQLKKVLELLLQAISIDPFVEYYNEIACIYDEDDNYEKAKYYYLKAIDNSDDVLAMYSLADLFRKESKSCDQEKAKYSTEMMLKYYAMAADKGDNEALELLCALSYRKDPVKFSVAFKKIMEHQDDHFSWEDEEDHDESKVIYGGFMRKTSNIEILKTLQNTDTTKMNEIEKKNITDCINLLNKETSVITYNNKVALFTRLNNVVECGICYDEKLNINLHCGHCVCVDCYQRLVNTSCPFCRMDTPYGFFD